MNDWVILVEYKSSRATMKTRYVASSVASLSLLKIPSHCRAFSMAKWEIFPSVVVEGNYKKILMAEKVYPCRTDKVGKIEHILLNCCFYQKIHQKILQPFLEWFHAYPTSEITRKSLLSHANLQLTLAYARFFVADCTICKEIWQKKNLLFPNVDSCFLSIFIISIFLKKNCKF